MSEERGLYGKYRIIKVETGEEITDEAFVLRPRNDPAARIALEAYAEAVRKTNLALYTDLMMWLVGTEDPDADLAEVRYQEYDSAQAFIDALPGDQQ